MQQTYFLGEDIPNGGETKIQQPDNGRKSLHTPKHQQISTWSPSERRTFALLESQPEQ
jgi:hypothetical protein